MTPKELKEMFEKYEDDFLEFNRVESRASNRHDLHAFMLLDVLVPSGGDGEMISSAEHDEIYLEVDPELLAKVITEEQILELVRCGVSYDSSIDSLCMFV